MALWKALTTTTQSVYIQILSKRSSLAFSTANMKAQNSASRDEA